MQLNSVPSIGQQKMDVSSDLEQDSLMIEHPRCIIHLDVDYFYAQVEELSHPEFKGKPMGVQQKNLVVTSNYEARSFGIKKCMSVDEALRLCPGLKLVRGEDLTPYRRMSAKISEVLHQFTNLVERLGLDENFIDVTTLVAEYSNKSCNDSRSTNDSFSSYKEIGCVYSEPEEECPCGCHNRLIIASNIANDIRQRIKSDLGLTCSAGVAHNKLLAKLGGGINKPDKQTIIYPFSAPSLLTSLGPVSKIPSVGRRTAESLDANHIRTVEDVRKTSLESLQVKVGRDLARKIKDYAEGIDEAPVKPSSRPQSIGLEDGFKKVSLVDEVESRLNVLLRRLCESAAEDGRVPLCIKLTVRKQDSLNKSSYSGKRESRQCALPPKIEHGKILALVMKLFHRVVDVSKPFHLTLLGLAFTKFQEEKSSGKSSIASFLRKQVAVQSVMDISSEEGLSDISLGSPMSTNCDCEESENEDLGNRVQFSNNCHRFVRSLADRATPSPTIEEDEDILSEVEPSPKKTKLEVWLSGRRESPSIEMEDLRLNTPSSSPISKNLLSGGPTVMKTAIPIDLDKQVNHGKNPNDLLKYFIANK